MSFFCCNFAAQNWKTDIVKNMKRSLLLLIAAMTLAACAPEKNNTGEAIARQMNDFPQSGMQDVYKSFYQDRFGPGHMIADTAAFGEYTRYELAVAAKDTVANPYFEPVGAQGRYVRVYLRCVNEGMLTAAQLTDAFIRSTVPAEQPEQSWADEWSAIEQAARQAGMSVSEEDSRQLMQAAQDNRAVHHSEAYRNAYHPHYRIVRRDIFNKEIKPLIYKSL